MSIESSAHFCPFAAWEVFTYEAEISVCSKDGNQLKKMTCANLSKLGLKVVTIKSHGVLFVK